MTAAAVTATGVGGTLMTTTAALMTAAALTTTGVGGTLMTTSVALTTAAAVTGTGVGGTLMTATTARMTAAAVTATGVGGTLTTTTTARMTAAAVTATRVGGTLSARAVEAELTEARVAGALLTAAGTHTAPESAMTDAAARMLPVAAAPSGVTVGNAAVAAAIDENAAAHSPIHPIPAPEGRHDRPRCTPGPTDPDPERAESEITWREVNRRILSPWPCTIDHGRVVIGRINDVRVGRPDYDVGPFVSTHDLVFDARLPAFCAWWRRN
jgi:hypothetical protein